MVRALLAVLACFALTGCWASEHPLFGPADWAPPADIAGGYEAENFSDGSTGRLVLSVGPDGAVEGGVFDSGGPPGDPAPTGFMPVDGSANRTWLFAFVNEDPEQGQIFFIARRTANGFDGYMPHCEGTSDGPGMVRDATGPGEMVCAFADRAAVLDAARRMGEALDRGETPGLELIGRMTRLGGTEAGADADADAGAEVPR